MNMLNANKTTARYTTYWICVTAIFMAINIAMSSFGIPVPGGHLYMNDIVICTAAILLDPLAAFMVGGVGAFLGDFFFYPAPMFVSLVTHGLQAVIISVFAEEASFDRIGDRRHDWCRYHGCWVLPWPCVCLQHARICDYQASVSDFTGGGWRCCWNDSLLAV